ncbi:MAG: DNA/RNA helicase domain-containing protein [Edaphobacter sp.]
MASYFRTSIATFLNTSETEVLAKLTLGYASAGFSTMHTDLPLTWWDDLASLRYALNELKSVRPSSSEWQILLEFSVPRKERRLDIVLLTGAEIILLECKRGPATPDAVRQVEEYALLLHYFHKPSHQHHIHPIIVSASTLNHETGISQQRELIFPTLPSFWISPTVVSSWSPLSGLLASISNVRVGPPNGESWDNGAYLPTPTIIDAALALRTGLNIREIAHSEAAEHDIETVTAEIRAIVESAQTEHRHAICFLTGVPGSGKTLVGLSLAHLNESRTDAIHFMSGNGPLVNVLQELFRKQGMRDGVPAVEARIQAQTLIENVHIFAKTYTDQDPDRPPSNHVIIFDEAQRAWNRAQNLSKFRRNYSEPEMLLKIMQRHQDWAVVIALVGGGQEIHSGEAGLEEWGKALHESPCDWQIYASPEVIEGGTSTAGHKLFATPNEVKNVHQRNTLHLRTSNRSLRADNLARWVNLVLDGQPEEAASLEITQRFPIFLTRSLNQTRTKLERESLGQSRFGLTGSSGALRLRAEGLEPSSDFHAGYPWHHWYLSPRSDIRSSFACEVFATEFEIQGLELDWIGLCWGGDFIWSGEGWVARDLRHGQQSKWGLVRSSEKCHYRENAYRVLLTRARQGMILYIPRGDNKDPTRLPCELDATAAYLLQCGVTSLTDDRSPC